MRLLGSILKSPLLGSIANSGSSAMKRQPSLAPTFLGGGLLAGVTAILIGGYKVVDCVRYQTAPGQCDKAIDANAPAIIGGVAAIFTGWGGFNTYNRKLHEDDPVAPVVDRRSLATDTPESEPLQSELPSKESIENYMALGATQEEAARFFRTTRYQIRKILNKEKSTRDRGR